MSKTIFGLATPAGRGALGVFRISGGDCGTVWTQLTGKTLLPKAREATVTQLRHPQHKFLLDSCLALHFPRPRSFTGEDTLEFHVHGSRAVLEGVADALLSVPNVTMAQPGEFARRAFENGKMTLTEVEALADLIASETHGQREQALRQLGGALTRLYESWRTQLVRALAHVEAIIDFADDDAIEESVYEAVIPEMHELSAEMLRHLQDDRKGERIREGCRLALCGPPNSGKSSLYNLLLQRNAAIVSDRPGTTRDVLEACVNVAGHAVRLADTAGLRSTDDDVERQGMDRARQEYVCADVRLLVLDAASSPERSLREFLPPALEPLPSAVVLNKSDLLSDSELNGVIERIRLNLGDLQIPVVTLSCVRGESSLLLAELKRLLGENEWGNNSSAPALTRPRHRAHVSRAREHLESFLALCSSSSAGPEVTAEELRSAVREIAAISGHVTVDEDVLGVIFKEFCIGK